MAVEMQGCSCCEQNWKAKPSHVFEPVDSSELKKHRQQCACATSRQSPPPLPPQTYLKIKRQSCEQSSSVDRPQIKQTDSRCVETLENNVTQIISSTPRQIGHQWGARLVTPHQRAAENQNDPAWPESVMTGNKSLQPESAATSASSNAIQHDAAVIPPEINFSKPSNENISQALYENASQLSNEENQPSENNNFNEEELDYFITSKSDTKTYFKKQLTTSSKILIQITGPKAVSLAQPIPAFRRHKEKFLRKSARPQNLTNIFKFSSAAKILYQTT